VLRAQDAVGGVAFPSFANFGTQIEKVSVRANSLFSANSLSLQFFCAILLAMVLMDALRAQGAAGGVTFPISISNFGAQIEKVGARSSCLVFFFFLSLSLFFSFSLSYCL